MNNFLTKLVMVVRIIKIIMRIVDNVLNVLDEFATKLSEKEAV